jgi:hypothetical protein
MNHKLMRSISFLAALLFCLASTAQETPLTDQLIDKYIQSLKKMQPLSDRINTEDTQGAATMAKLWLEGDTAAINQHLETKPYYAELATVVEQSGFESTANWVETAQRITQAYMALELGGQEEQVAAQMEASLQQVRDNEYLDEVQKENLIQQLRASQVHLSNLQNVSAADQAAVKPHREKLRNYFETAK